MPTETKPEPLSDIPSVAILQALEDLEACERDFRYRINMHKWHTPGENQCHVCLAGSVMAKRYDAAIDCSHAPDCFPPCSMLVALDDFRKGAIYIALIYLGLRVPSVLSGRACVTDYKDNPAAFKSDMRRMAALLAEHGL